MITKFSDVDKVDSWDAAGGIDGPANKDSKLTLNDHKRVVFTAKAKIATFDPEAVDFPAGVKTAFSSLKACYEAEEGLTLKITKGIHQPYVDPHMNVRVYNADGPVTGVFHLNMTTELVDLSTLPGTVPGRLEATMDRDPFIWLPHCFGYKPGEIIYSWKQAAGPRVGKDFSQSRRNSISERALGREIEGMKFRIAMEKVGTQLSSLLHQYNVTEHVSRDEKQEMARGAEIVKGSHKFTWNAGTERVVHTAV